MSWFFAVLVVLAVGAVAVVFAGGGGSAAPAYDDRPDSGLPDDRPLTAGDLRAVRLSTAVRGYRADEVDELLERLARQLEGAAPERTDNAGDGSAGHDVGSGRPAGRVVLEPGERPRYPEVTDR